MEENIEKSKLIKIIVERQVGIIGHLAIEQANRVGGVKVSDDLSSVSISGNLKDVLEKLVLQYERLFGQASVEACKDALREVKSNISQEELPSILR
ncbi:MAG: hypothetical protein UT24_C0004G0032 [Candidatus Woesebacteria bacterium GW2011_GWB1_39_12]|uniref:Uncharacterized protein n=2 Tax=Candidatus Woeseibacteriota TaxID=1752722 RepID=A0A0G0PJY7_9BACT|nr:MAG: hypothetical protein UT23_C0003G0036 [Candidatus Woesebacteria bacterium GW2011_GWA1_39_12]KKR01469.1 MAG: hypothetical protein UT24_C0004G0032 [Candidatus Woesebacteria bacterium GW2011_GWB1_39_12]